MKQRKLSAKNTGREAHERMLEEHNKRRIMDRQAARMLGRKDKDGK